MSSIGSPEGFHPEDRSELAEVWRMVLKGWSFSDIVLMVSYDPETGERREPSIPDTKIEHLIRHADAKSSRGLRAEREKHGVRLGEPRPPLPWERQSRPSAARDSSCVAETIRSNRQRTRR